MREKFFAAANQDGPVCILGLGAHGGGVGAARFFARLGVPVIVSDLKTRRELAPSIAQLKRFKNIQYVLGRHPFHEMQKAALIVKNPGVPNTSPVIRHARMQGKPITNDGALFLELAPRERIIGVTGTKGKTTTTALISRLLGSSTYVVGTPGSSFFDLFELPRMPRWIVAEFSSFDLEYTHTSPHIAVITSLFPDHLNRYTSFAAYAKAKMNIIKYQTSHDRAFVWRSPMIRKYIPRTKSTIERISYIHSRYEMSWRIAPEAASIAIRVAKTLKVPRSHIAHRLKRFEAPTGRLEIVSRNAKRTWINDTTATNPGAAAHSLAMLHKFAEGRSLIVITGGEDKKFPSYAVTEYAEALRKHHAIPVIIPGSFSKNLIRKLQKYPYILAHTMNEAVRQAHQHEGIVALVPGAASFNMFRNEFDRGDHFITAIRSQKHP